MADESLPDSLDLSLLMEKQGDICVKLYEKFHYNGLLVAALARYFEQLQINKNSGSQDNSTIYSSIAMTYSDLDDLER